MVTPFDASAAAAYGILRASAPKQQERKDALDKLIASHAVALEAALITNNEDDFRRYPDVVIENWVA